MNRIIFWFIIAVQIYLAEVTDMQGGVNQENKYESKCFIKNQLKSQL